VQGGLEAEAVLSARAGDPFNDPGPFLETTLSFPLLPHTALVLAGGRYFTTEVARALGPGARAVLPEAGARVVRAALGGGALPEVAAL